jgi:hypothetical protein
MAVPVRALDCDMPRKAVHFWSDLVATWERCSEWRGRDVRNRGCRTYSSPNNAATEPDHGGGAYDGELELHGDGPPMSWPENWTRENVQAAREMSS